MHISWKQRGNTLSLEFKLSERDTRGPHRNANGYHRYHILQGNSFDTWLPDGMDIEQTHTDLLALVAILVFDHFVGEEIVLPLPVSKELHDAYRKVTGKNIVPFDASVRPRTTNKTYKPALAFSVGVDSTAAAAILPANTALVYTHSPMVGRKHNTTAALQACDILKKQGRNVYVIRTTLESIIEPATYTNTLAPAVPAILLADYLKFDTIATGNILEAAYGLITYSRYIKGQGVIGKLDPVFRAANLAPSHVTAGLTEVSTTKIVQSAGLADIAQSCVFGEALGKPCNNCTKCFRKKIMGDILAGKETAPGYIDKLLGTEELEAALRKVPMTLQNAYMFLVSNIQTNHKMIKLLRKKLQASKRNTNWMWRWYSPSSTLIAPRYRKLVAANIQKHIEPMTRQDIKQLESWNLSNQRTSPKTLFWHWRFWSVYTARYGKCNLSFEHNFLTLKVGTRKKLRVKMLKGLRKIDVSSEVQWSSNRKDILVAKKGVVQGISGGMATINCRYGESKVKLQAFVADDAP